MSSARTVVCVLAIAIVGALAAQASAQAPDHSTWPGVYDPFHVFDLHLEMDSGDFSTIRNDSTNEIEVPAMFNATGETPILVSVRRKSSRTVSSAPNKFSMKVDINEFEDEPGGAELWHGVNKLSLENGVDNSVVAEGLAWNLHELASAPEFYGPDYHAGLAAWVRLFVNGEYLGVYANVEQRDNRFLRNRGLPRRDGERWLYEIDDMTGWELEAGELPHSPTFQELCYKPFSTTKKPACATPDAETLAARLPEIIEMDEMLVQGAIDAFSSNADALFSHGKNFRHADFADPALKRRYYMWDLDGALTNAGSSIYARGSGRKLAETDYQKIILGNPAFRAQYNGIMCGLTDPATGPLSVGSIHGFLDDLEPLLTSALDADPAVAGSPGALFDTLRSFATNQVTSVRSQVAADRGFAC